MNATSKVSDTNRPGADVTAAAALTICESLMLALNDRNILPEREIVGVLQAAAKTHEDHPTDAGQAETHAALAKLTPQIIDGRNSLRRQ